jgi:hypothetical protein
MLNENFKTNIDTTNLIYHTNLYHPMPFEFILLSNLAHAWLAVQNMFRIELICSWVAIKINTELRFISYTSTSDY